MSWRDPGADPFVGLADDAVHEAAVRARQDRQARHQAAIEVATWVGTLRDVAERDVPIVLGVAGARRHRGVLTGLARDHVAMRLTSGVLVLVALDLVRSVRPDPGAAAPPSTGDREHALDRTLGEVLQRYLEHERILVLRLRDDDDPIRATVVGLGEDVLTLRLAGDAHGTVYVPLAAVAEVLVEGPRSQVTPRRVPG